jgi:hypothetical protein
MNKIVLKLAAAITTAVQVFGAYAKAQVFTKEDW